MSLLRRLVITFGLGLHLALVLVAPALAFVPPASGVIDGVRVVPGVARGVAPFLWRGLAFGPWGVAGVAAFCIVANGSDYSCIRPASDGAPWPADGIVEEPTTVNSPLVQLWQPVQVSGLGSPRTGAAMNESEAFSLVHSWAGPAAVANFGVGTTVTFMSNGCWPGVRSGACVTDCRLSGGSVVANCMQNWFRVDRSSLMCPIGFSAVAGGSGGTACSGPSCRAGLTLVGGKCVGTIYTPNGAPTTRATGFGTVPDPADPDVGAASIGAAGATVSGRTAEGQPIRIRIEVLPDGGVRVTQEVQHSTGGNTQTAVTQVTIAPNGAITGQVSSNAPGAMATNPANPAPGTTPVPIEFPTDYAREPTTQAMRGDTKALRDDVEAARVQGDAYKAPQLPSDYGDASKLGLPAQETFAVPEVVPGVSGSDGCQPLSLGLWGMQADVCPWLARWRPIIDWGFVAACGIATMTTLLKRTEV